MLEPTFASVAVAAVSAVIAFNTAAVGLPVGLGVELALMTGLGTFVGCKLGKAALKTAGEWAGLGLGFLGGGIAGNMLAGRLNRNNPGTPVNKAQAAGMTALVGAGALSAALSAAGAVTGFAGGAYLGHSYTAEFGRSVYEDQLRLSVPAPVSLPPAVSAPQP